MINHPSAAGRAVRAFVAGIFAMGMATQTSHAEEGQGREFAGTWLAVTLTDDVELKQAGWGAAEHHREAELIVSVDEKLKGTGAIKKGDALTIKLYLHKSLISPAVENGKKGDQLFLGLPESDYSNLEVRVDFPGKAVLCKLDDALNERLHKEKNLPIGWYYDSRQELISPFASLREQALEARLSDPSDIGVVCSKSGVPAYTTGNADVSIEWVNAEFGYYDFKQLGKLIEGSFSGQEHFAKIIVANKTKEKITVPALRRIGDRILWNHSAWLNLAGRGPRLVLPREKITEKTEAVTLDPGQSVSGLIDIYLADDFPVSMLTGYGGSRVSGLVVLGGISAWFILHEGKQS